MLYSAFQLGFKTCKKETDFRFELNFIKIRGTATKTCFYPTCVNTLSFMLFNSLPFSSKSLYKINYLQFQLISCQNNRSLPVELPEPETKGGHWRMRVLDKR